MKKDAHFRILIIRKDDDMYIYRAEFGSEELLYRAVLEHGMHPGLNLQIHDAMRLTKQVEDSIAAGETGTIRLKCGQIDFKED